MSSPFEDNSAQVVPLFYKAGPDTLKLDGQYVPRRKDSLIPRVCNEEFGLISDDDNSISGPPSSSDSSSFIAELDDTSVTAIKSKKQNPVDSVMLQWGMQPDLMCHQALNQPSISVGKAFDQTIAVIEATNRDLLTRIQATEESTRILQEQNSDLQRTIDEFTRQNLGRAGSVSAIDMHYGSRPYHSGRLQPIISHNRQSPSLSASMHTKVSNNFFDIDAIENKGINQHLRSKSRPTTRMLGPDFNNTRSHSNFHKPLTPPPPTLLSNSQSELRRNSRKPSIEANRPNLKVTTNNMKCLPSISTIPADAKAEPLSSHPISSISAPLPGTIRHHQISLEGINFSNNTRPKIISLEEAQKRAKNPSSAQTSPDLYSSSQNISPIAESVFKKKSLEISSPEPGINIHEGSMRLEKKKGRFQDFIKGRRHS